MNEITFRYAERSDCPLILRFIKELAEYQKLDNELSANEELLYEWLFDKACAEVIFCLYDGREVGFALFYNNFSTLVGKCGIHLEDLYVEPEYRGRGCGKALLQKLAEITRERGFERLDWCCLNWNKRSIDFYVSLGAIQMSGWTSFRLSGEALKNI